MAIYMIGYDLHPVDGQNYDDLFAALERIGSGYWDCLDSAWLVMTDKTAFQIKDELKPYLKEGDRMLVLRCGAEAAWLGFKNQCETWLEDNMAVAAR